MPDEVPISKAVNQRLTNLALTRDGNVLKAEWKVPAWMKDTSNPARATWVDASIDFACHPDNSPSRVEVWQTPYYSDSKRLDITLGYDHYWVRGLEQGGAMTDTSNIGTEFEKPYDRSRYYPLTSKKCLGMTVGVHGGNGYGYRESDHGDLSEGVWGRGPTIYQTFPFYPPAQPEGELLGWDDDEFNYQAKFKINANRYDQDESKNNAERYDTRYRAYRQDNLPGSGYSKRKPLHGWFETDEDEFTVYENFPENIRNLADGQWVEVVVEVYSRGMAGDGPHINMHWRASRPVRGTITSIKASSLSTVTGVVTVNVKVPYVDHMETTRAKLQRLKNVLPNKTAEEVAAMDGWQDVSGMVEIDDDQDTRMASYASGFCDSVAAAYPNANRRTWYRVVTENTLYYDDDATISTPVEASVLYHARSAETSEMFIESLSTTADATAIRMLLGWPAETPANTGTEISWSAHEDAWQSSEPPTTANAEWKDATSQGTHANSAPFTIYGVEPGTPYYIKARRYLVDENDETTFGPYATAAAGSYPFVPAQPPRDLTLTAPSFVPRGSDVPLSWTFESEAPQTAWSAYIVADGVRTAVASGTDSIGACTVPANMLSGNSATFVVSMTTGSEWADSQEAEVTFADPPTIGTAFPTASDPDYTTTWPLLLEQPVTLICSSDTGDDLLHVRVLSNGIAYSLPDRDLAQSEGEPVFDAWVSPTWASDGSSWYTALSLPTGLDLVDVGTYTWEVTAQNVESGLLSDTVTGAFKVRWAHQAHVASDADVTVDFDGRIVAIKPTAPDNLADTDVFDLYRVTPDGADLIASGLRYGSAVTDRFAPYGSGELAYRVATRTRDGDVAWRDFAYQLDCKTMRFDWDMNSLELPYDIVREDGWSKDFEQRAHLDGSVGGGWNVAVTRTASLSTDLIRFRSEEEQRLVRSLARHAGAVFVRLPNGCAYEADVQVSNMGESYNSGAIACSFQATQIDLTEEFMVGNADVDTSDVADRTEVEYGISQIVFWGKESPSAGDTFTLLKEPSGTVLAELTASHDYYSDTWSIPNTVSGTTLMLGTLSAELRAFIAEAIAEDGSVRIIARYDAEGANA